jgi:hypothetical protein
VSSNRLVSAHLPVPGNTSRRTTGFLSSATSRAIRRVGRSTGEERKRREHAGGRALTDAVGLLSPRGSRQSDIRRNLNVEKRVRRRAVHSNRRLPSQREAAVVAVAVSLTIPVPIPTTGNNRLRLNQNIATIAT